MLAQPCPAGPASQYGTENLKAFRDGRTSHNKPMPADEFSYQDSIEPLNVKQCQLQSMLSSR